ncbi:hypothetical protein [Streptomyces hydrogenans]|uniref:hypothetical protein n=1 Tax=Streptomyces hydrogenans TaxID=1873719 RepID=UPI0033251ECA
MLGRRPVPPISPTWLPKLCDLIGGPQNGSEGAVETLLLALQSTRPGATLRLARCGEALRRLRTLFGNRPVVIWIRF